MYHKLESDQVELSEQHTIPRIISANNGKGKKKKKYIYIYIYIYSTEGARALPGWPIWTSSPMFSVVQPLNPKPLTLNP